MNLSLALCGRLCKLVVQRCSDVSDDVAAMVTKALLDEKDSDGLLQQRLPWERAAAAGRHVEVDISGGSDPLEKLHAAHLARLRSMLQ